MKKKKEARVCNENVEVLNGPIKFLSYIVHLPS
jgi:hypothetical protein